jgi:hypothetical protein
MAQIRFGIAAGELELISEEVNRFFVGSSVTK